MGWTQDAVEEFKKAPKGAKIVMGLLGISAIGLGYYEYSKNKATGVSTANSIAGTPGSTNLGGQIGGSNLDMQSLASAIAGMINTNQPANNPPPSSGGTSSSGPPVRTLWSDLFKSLEPGTKITVGGNNTATPGLQRFWYTKDKFFLAPSGSKISYKGSAVFITVPGQGTKQLSK